MANNHGIRKQTQQVVVVVVPLPMQGHLNQLLHLSRLLSAYNIPVHFVGTATHNRQAMLRVHGCNPSSFAGIHFHDFSIPSFPSPLPDPNQNTTKFPCHLQPLFEATRHLRKPIRALLRELSSNTERVAVIHDSLMSSVVQDFVSLPNAESYIFHSVSAFAMSFYFCESMGKQSLQYCANNNNNNNIPHHIIPSLERCFSAEFLDFIASQHECQSFKSGCLFNTSRVIEKPYMDLLDRTMGTKASKNWAIGPFNPILENQHLGNRRKQCLDWLDKQAPKSVMYVCFGTSTALAEEQIKEIAFGLEQSRQKFIWALREADRGDVFVDNGSAESRKSMELPKGYEERVKSVGIVVREWAPQLEILGHSSTGGFMSHCGWNSCIESITMGVPIAAWPMHSDQPRNAVLVTEFLKTGIALRDWAGEEAAVTASAVANGVRKLMSSEQGDEIRKRAAELGLALRHSMSPGGSSRLELESFISHIAR